MSWRRLRTSAAAVQYGAADTSPAVSDTAVTGARATGTCTPWQARDLGVQREQVGVADDVRAADVDVADDVALQRVGEHP